MISARSSLLVVSLFSVAACGAPQGLHVRFAHASHAEIQAAHQGQQPVWYDFEAGDEVPLAFGLIGVSQAITEQPTRMIARRPFSIVVFPGGQTMFSFDGQTLTSPEYAARWSIGLDSDERGGSAALLVFIGQPDDMPAELQQQ